MVNQLCQIRTGRASGVLVTTWRVEYAKFADSVSIPFFLGRARIQACGALFFIV